jgi:DNA-binding LacI/PurR family transcriptional regulator
LGNKPSQTVDSVVNTIRLQIKSGSFRSGTVLPSEQMLASSFGVSRGTVRRAIDRLVESGSLTRKPYSRPIIAENQPVGKLGNEVYVWVSRPIADDQALILLKEISKGLRGTSYRLVVREPTRFVGTVVKSEEREFLYAVLENPDVAGAIIERDPYSENADVFAQLIAHGKHLVFVDTPPPEGISADFVGTSNAVAARICVEHLQALGHNRIFFAADCDIPPAAKDRIKGYWRAMRLAGIEALGRELVAGNCPKVQPLDKPLGGPYARIVKKNDYFSDLAMRIVDEVLSSTPRPTALFACHDVMAYWICAILEAKGVSVPEDISVMGFDWLAKWDEAIPDTLTSAAQDFAGFGRHAANLLLDRLTGEVPQEPRHVLLDAPLVVRSSTATNLTLPILESRALA